MKKPVSLLFHKINPFFLLLILPAFAAGQVDFFPCEKQNQDLKKLFTGDTLHYLYVHSCSGVGMEGLSSSFLLPTGNPPQTGFDDDDQEIEAMGKYEIWSCRYAAGNLGDKDPATAWVEGVDGQGIGEVIMVPCLDFDKTVYIWTGYGKSENLFYANSRPKKIRLCIIRGQDPGITQYGIVWEELVVISENEADLEDMNFYQEIVVPEFKVDSFYFTPFDQVIPYEYFLGLEILEVYPGSKYEDTCISEITSMDK